MVWLVEKKVFYHTVELGIERVKIPIRVKFEFDVKDGSFISDSLSFETLYNRQILQKRYPNAKIGFLENEIEKTVKRNIYEYLNACGYLRPDTC
jgi:hypothetical protein